MNYLKAGAMVVATVLSAILATIVGNGSIGPSEWVNVAILGAGACAVFTAPNVPGASYVKEALAVIIAVLTVLQSVIVGGVSTTDIIQMVLAGLGALGVFAAPYSYRRQTVVR